MEDKLKEAVRVYDKIARIYSNYTYQKIVQYQLTKFISFLKGKKILDAGCGPGRDTESFLEDGFDVVGVDISKKMIEEAKKNVPKGKFKVMDFREMKFKDKEFDGVWAMASLVHIDKRNMPKVLKEFNRVLNEKGALFIRLKEGKGKVEINESKYGGDDGRTQYLHDQEKMIEYLDGAGFDVIVSLLSIL
jgi:ubiquinone/menaquinone biosynthesis C-methylase UbiE